MHRVRPLLVLLVLAVLAAAPVAALRLFAERGQRAVRIGAMSARQARSLLDEQTGTVDAFMRRPYRTTDQQRDYAALVCHLPAPH